MSTQDVRNHTHTRARSSTSSRTFFFARRPPPPSSPPSTRSLTFPCFISLSFLVICHWYTLVAVRVPQLIALDASYARGTLRVIVVFESPRAMFRINEIIDALHPFFAGGSLGWHD